MAELLASAEESKFKCGSLVEGTVSAIKDGDVFIDIGYKSEGAVSVEEFGDAGVNVGDKVTVLLRELENDKTGMVTLSKRAADDKIRWDKILERYHEGDQVTGTVKAAVRGGLLVSIDDVEAFLPGSQIEVSPVKELEPYVGQTFDFKVIKISNERRNLIISRRELIEGTLAEKKAELLASLQKGEIRKGRVKNITDFGAFVDLDGLDGLLHITDMSWGRIKHPSEMLKVGQELDVMVLDVDRDRERVSLGLKQIQPNPWDAILDQFPVGSRVSGKVVNLAAYGAFVEIAPGIEGLVHISEFSWTKRVARASDMLAVGDEVQVVVLSIDTENQEIALGIRQTQANPWDTVQDRYPVGSKVSGKVRNFTAYGAFVELEEGIDGMIHVSDMSWTRKINHPSEMLQKGETVELEDGTIYTPQMVLGEERKGIKLTYVTDTRPTDSIVNNAKDSDLFICEGMYGEPDKLVKAKEHKHMTFYEAAKLGKKAEVKEMWLTHYSPSLVNPQEFIGETRKIFANTVAAKDGRSLTLRFEE